MTAHALVIGGGIIGLSTCFEFQDAGFEVTLVDPDPISGATHHAGGMLAPPQRCNTNSKHWFH